MQALANGDITFSPEQISQAALLFEELKLSKLVKVKEESVAVTHDLEASASARDDGSASSSARDDGSAEESKDVELVLSFDNETQMRFASNYATKVHQTIRNFGVMAILRTVRPDFKNATYPMAFILTSCSTWLTTLPMLSSSFSA